MKINSQVNNIVGDIDYFSSSSVFDILKKLQTVKAI